MNLVQQFPDISQNLRSKNEKGNRSFRAANAKQSLKYIESESVAQYYEGEFRRWHIKFLFLVAVTCGLIYVVLLKSFWIYNLVNLR